MKIKSGKVRIKNGHTGTILIYTQLNQLEGLEETA
jgi:hypothetical protein